METQTTISRPRMTSYIHNRSRSGSQAEAMSEWYAHLTKAVGLREKHDWVMSWR